MLENGRVEDTSDTLRVLYAASSALTLGDDSWDIVGQPLRMHNSFWGWTDDDYSTCRVVGYVGKFRFNGGNTAKHTYVIECDGHYYPATHTTVAGALLDASVKRRVKKSPPPRLL